MHDAIWFDLDQLRRQSKLHGKPYRMESEYQVLYTRLDNYVEQIKAIEQKYSAPDIIDEARRISYDFMKPRCEAFMKDGAVLPPASQEEIRSKCQEWLKDRKEIPEICTIMEHWIMEECNWVEKKEYKAYGERTIIDEFFSIARHITHAEKWDTK
jgi:hypothetical protein